MTRLQSIKTLKRKADRLLQKSFVQEFPICLVCGKPTSEGHHYIPKSQSNNLRYDFTNLIPLCRAYHFKHHMVGDPHIMEVILHIKGEEWAEDLNIRRRVIRKLNKTYLKEVIKELT